jgi:hypothetical protein
MELKSKWEVMETKMTSRNKNFFHKLYFLN